MKIIYGHLVVSWASISSVMPIIADQTDEQIVSHVRAGDVDAYGELMQRYEQKLLRYVIYLVHDDAIAADAVQDAFIKAYQNLNGFNHKYKFSSWVYRIAHNEAMNAIKKAGHSNHDIDVEEVQEANAESTTAQRIDREILKADVASCIDKLDPKYREIIILQYYENMKYREIADILHIPVATVGVWASRGKAALKQLCKQKGVRYEQ